MGAVRQLYGFWLGKALVMRLVDNQGNEKLTYIGTVPPEIWQSSAWFRALSWLIVVLTSVFSALVGAVFAERILEGAFAPTIIAILITRWFTSSIPKRLSAFQPE